MSFIKTYDYILVVMCVTVIYALIGVFFFRGQLENRCRITPNPTNTEWIINSEIPFLCGEFECPEKLKI